MYHYGPVGHPVRSTADRGGGAFKRKYCSLFQSASLSHWVMEEEVNEIELKEICMQFS